MRAYEFINEGKKVGDLPKAAERSASELIKMRDDGYDRANHLNRMMMAAAMHDGKSSHPVDMDAYSWAERYNTAHPYTKEESNMINGAMKTVGGQHKDIVDDDRSLEMPDVHKVSPVSSFRGYKTKRTSR